MATVAIDGLELVVRLSALEKLAACRVGDPRFALSSVTDVAVEPNAWAALRGIRAPGTGVPYLIVHGGKRPGLRVDFDGDAPYSRLIVTVGDPQASAQAIRAATGRT